MLKMTLRFGAVFAITCGVAACAGSTEALRKVTYPSSFQYLSDQELRTAMGRLAKSVVELDAIVREPEPTRSEHNAELLEILRSMRSVSSSISKGGDTNHRRIDRHLPNLIDDIDRAIAAADNRSPNYYYAGSVVGACEYCHQPRHEPVHRDPIPAGSAGS